MTRSALPLTALILTMLACQASPLFVEDTPTQPAPSMQELKFEDLETEAHFQSLNQCIDKLTAENWRTTGYQIIGNFYESRWCTGEGARDDCQIASATQNNRDQHMVGLNTLSYSDEPKKMFGLGFQSLWVPQSTGWGAAFFFNEKGKTIMGEGWSVNFNLYKAQSGEPEDSISLGDQYTYKINETTISMDSDLALRDDLDVYLQSPESMRDRGTDQMQELLAKVIESLGSHQITACDWGEYQGNGIPPVCNPRPMTIEEEAAEVKKALLYFDQQINLLNQNYTDMYAAWMKSFPFDSCWQ